MTVDPSQATQLLSGLAGGAAISIGGIDVFAPDSTTGSDESGFGPAAVLSFGGGFSTDAILQAALLPARALPLQRSQAASDEEQATLTQAQNLVLAGQNDDAQQLAEGLLEKDPQDARATHILGQIALNERRYEDAEKLFRKADYFDPNAGFAADADNAHTLQQSDEKVLATAARLMRSNDSAGDGVRLLANIVQRSPDNADAKIQLAEGLLAQHDAAGALQQYADAIETADGTQLDAIGSRLKELADISPDSAAVRRLLGRAQYRQGDFENAALSYAAADRIAGGDDSIRADQALADVALARQHLAEGDIAGAFGSLSEAQDLNFGGEEVNHALAEAYVARGEQLTQQGAYTGGINDLKQAIFGLNLYRIDDDDLRGRLGAAAYRAGRALEAQREQSGGDVGKEVIAFQAAHDAQPDNAAYTAKLAETRYRMGQEFAADGKLKEAAYAFGRAADLLPNNGTYKTAAITAFQAWGADAAHHQRFDDAITAYAAAYKLDRTNGDSKTGLAEAYNARGVYRRTNEQFGRAASDFQEALRLYPDNDTYRSNYESVRYR